MFVKQLERRTPRKSKYTIKNRQNDNKHNSPSENEERKQTLKEKRKKEEDEIDKRFGFDKYEESEEKIGFLFNFRTTAIVDDDGEEWSAVDCYFIGQNEETFKATVKFNPYFYIGVKDKTIHEVENVLRRKYGDIIHNITIVEKENLDLPNHLSGILSKYLKISFKSIQQLLALRKVILPLVEKNKKRQATMEVYEEDLDSDGEDEKPLSTSDFMDCIIDIREYDVRYYIRVAIDLGLNAGHWYKVKYDSTQGNIVIQPYPKLVTRPPMKICAFDIEATKQPLKFPDPKNDQIIMISYMIGSQGYLIINREIVVEDIEDFEYKGNSECQGQFTIFNEENEKKLLEKWFEEMKEEKPLIYATYNGDSFDWGFIEARAKVYGINMRQEIGYYYDSAGELYKSTYGIHMDAFHWVRRDSYLPQGSQGLKAVTRAKLGYDPIEINPEEITLMAKKNPHHLASYSVSDALATYFLYMKYVHPFIFSLCTIIPMPPDDVLRKGSGTLCEQLLMVEAFRANIICPNKHTNDPEKMYKGHLIESETYVGGHVEALKSGIYRSDLKYKFEVDPKAYQKLIDHMDETLKFAIEVENKIKLENVKDYEKLKTEIVDALKKIRDTPKRYEVPKIYHLDVGAMYPNIILTNRLQPVSIVNEDICASCIFNKPENRCKRNMNWEYRVQYFSATASDYKRVKQQLEGEQFPPPQGNKNGEWIKFGDLPQDQQAAIIRKRLSSLKGYTKKYQKETMMRTDTVCMRENPFYVNTVLKFRDRRYEYKKKLKEWQKKYAIAVKEGKGVQEATEMKVLYDSLQLAHKCILNSFYGYVMRRGARWYSMEMAGIVTHYGANIIKMTRELIEKVGIPLELDTDGIWCMLPGSFPENFKFHTKDGQSFVISYPCVMLNVQVANKFTNDQYQELVDPVKRTYKISNKCTIFFEVDGPYRAMILPASQTEGKGIKKRYAVFNMNGTLAELKGFEIKRRGELKIIKHFQEKIFKKFLQGSTLEECYKIVGAEADIWLDILYCKGQNLDSTVLFDYITESSNMSKSLDDYGDQKSSRITVAKRLAEILGDQVVKDKGLNCHYIISKKPEGALVTERAIPVEVFAHEPKIALEFLRKWTKDKSLKSVDVRDIVDWDYYIERLSSAIQKIITIPAAFQKIENPVKRVQHPDWLSKKLKEKQDARKQYRITDMFSTEKENSNANVNINQKQVEVMDIESIVGETLKPNIPRVTKHVSKKRKRDNLSDDELNLDSIVPPKKLQSQFNSLQKLDADFFEDSEFKLFLKFQKKKWRELRERKKRRKTGIGLDLDAEQTTHTSIGSFLRQQQLALKHSDWQIVQIRETDIPGVMKLFVLLKNSMQTINIRVPRTVYINFREKIDSTKGQKIVKMLPRNHPALNLYEREIPEDIFQANSKDLHEYFTDPNIEGIYETQVPLVFRSVMELGCACTVNPKSKDKIGTSETLSLSDLQMKEKGFRYLDSDIRKIYMYHSVADQRGIIGLFFLATNTAKVYIVQPFAQAERPNLNLEKMLKENTFSESQITQPLTQPTYDIQFVLTYVSSHKQAYKRAQADLEVYQQERRGPSVVIAQTPITIGNLCHSMPVLNDFPVIPMAFNNEDSRYPPLKWIMFCTKRMLQRFMMVDEWFADILNYSKYSCIPIGNIEPDYPIYITDLLYSRILKNNGHVLWISEGPRPDLGGLEDDDNELLIAENIQNTVQICHSGSYHNVCVELELIHLDINTIIQSKFINDIEGIQGDMSSELRSHEINIQQQTKKTTESLLIYDESILCSESFKLLKVLVSQWFKEVGESNSEQADTLLSHFYRWIMNPHAKLYDPALAKMIFKMMKKVFLQLLANMKKLGSKVVYANFNKIIICTPKHTKEDAEIYVDYILKNIQKKKLFTFLKLIPKRYWDQLLWMDPANFGGLKSKEKDEEKQELIIQWNIAEYLPKPIQQQFIVSISEFIYKLNAERHKYIQTNPSVRPDEVTKHQETFTKEIIQSYFTPMLLKTTTEIQKLRDVEFPQLPGSYLEMQRPSLEFIKCVCHILGLDKFCKDEVIKMKQNLLKLINIREFSDEAKFKNPCRTFILSDVICTYCNSCKDLDLCRDKSLMSSIWKCNECSHEYDKDAIEGRLVEHVQQSVICYQVQDLKCDKCNQIKVDNMSINCHCSGHWVCKESKREMKEKLITFKNIAQYHKFEWLGETVEFLLHELI